MNEKASAKLQEAFSMLLFQGILEFVSDTDLEYGVVHTAQTGFFLEYIGKPVVITSCGKQSDFCLESQTSGHTEFKVFRIEISVVGIDVAIT